MRQRAGGIGEQQIGIEEAARPALGKEPASLRHRAALPRSIAQRRTTRTMAEVTEPPREPAPSLNEADAAVCIGMSAGWLKKSRTAGSDRRWTRHVHSLWRTSRGRSTYRPGCLANASPGGSWADKGADVIKLTKVYALFTLGAEDVRTIHPIASCVRMTSVLLRSRGGMSSI
jgi:hypothetical protein